MKKLLYIFLILLFVSNLYANSNNNKITINENNIINMPNEDLKFQKSELEKYLKLLNANNIAIEIGIKPFEGHNNDTYSIIFSNGKGSIYGNNKIALTNGIYAFFEQCGIRFIRPGNNGDYIPKNAVIPEMDIISEASFNNRGICIEGAVSKDHVIKVIDWQTKVGMNSYFTQFRQSHVFFERWYHHASNKSAEKTEITLEDSKQFLNEIINKINERGTVYHAVGHGWTCFPFGFSDNGWDNEKNPPSDDIKHHFALVGDKRDWIGNCPMATNLCYSNPETRQIVINNVKEYLKENPSVDVLHLWLADSANSHCECEECQKMTPSDYYVVMLNELDEILTKAGINTKIVFLIYYDTLYAPQFEKIKNQDRFIIMFAPITRNYYTTFADVKEINPPAKYERNKIKVPATDEEHLALYKEWNKIFSGDSFIFDYYLMWSHVKDVSNVYLAQKISEDIRAYDKIPINGLISCQAQRQFMPTSLSMYVMAKTLWNKNLTYEEIEADYFKHAFGEKGDYAKEILYNLKDTWKFENFSGNIIETQKNIDCIKEAVKYLEQELPNVYKIINNTNDPFQKESWNILVAHLEITLAFGRSFVYKLQKDKKNFLPEYNKLIDLVRKYDIQYQDFFDGWAYFNILYGILYDYSVGIEY